MADCFLVLPGNNPNLIRDTLLKQEGMSELKVEQS